MLVSLFYTYHNAHILNPHSIYLINDMIPTYFLQITKYKMFLFKSEGLLKCLFNIFKCWRPVSPLLFVLKTCFKVIAQVLFLSINCFTHFYYIKLRNLIYGTFACKNVSNNTGNLTRDLPYSVIDPLKSL